jgi:hypothetical protein
MVSESREENVALRERERESVTRVLSKLHYEEFFYNLLQ